MISNLASSALYRKYEEEKSLLELYGRVSSLTYEEWLETKKTNNVKESINYWMSRCASLQQEVDVLNRKLANASMIHWQTGEPKESGIYFVSTSNNMVRTAYWNNSCWLFNDLPFSTQKIKAWCKLSDIKPYKEEKK